MMAYFFVFMLCSLDNNRLVISRRCCRAQAMVKLPWPCLSPGHVVKDGLRSVACSVHVPAVVFISNECVYLLQEFGPGDELNAL